MSEVVSSRVKTAAIAAIEACGGGAALARRLGVTRFAIQHWKSVGIPPARVWQVAKASGIPPHVLRPDLTDMPIAPPSEAP